MMLVARRCEPPINWTLPCGDEPYLFEWTSAVTDDFYSRLLLRPPGREGTESMTSDSLKSVIGSAERE